MGSFNRLKVIITLILLISPTTLGVDVTPSPTSPDIQVPVSDTSNNSKPVPGPPPAEGVIPSPSIPTLTPKAVVVPVIPKPVPAVPVPAVVPVPAAPVPVVTFTYIEPQKKPLIMPHTTLVPIPSQKCPGIMCAPPTTYKPGASMSCREGDESIHPMFPMIGSPLDCCPVHICLREDGSEFIHYGIQIEGSLLENARRSKAFNMDRMSPPSPFSQYQPRGSVVGGSSSSLGSGPLMPFPMLNLGDDSETDPGTMMMTSGDGSEGDIEPPIPSYTMRKRPEDTQGPSSPWGNNPPPQHFNHKHDEYRHQPKPQSHQSSPLRTPLRQDERNNPLPSPSFSGFPSSGELDQDPLPMSPFFMKVSRINRNAEFYGGGGGGSDSSDQFWEAEQLPYMRSKRHHRNVLEGGGVVAPSNQNWRSGRREKRFIKANDNKDEMSFGTNKLV